MSLRMEIRGFIVENFLKGQDSDNLKHDTSFLEEGIIDSTGLLELVAFLDDEYKIEMESEELIPENLNSIKNLCEYIERKQS